MNICVEEFQRSYFTSANCRLSYVDFGNCTKPDLLLLHGMRDHALSMVELARAFRDDYHVIALDLRGHGYSHNPGIYTMVQFVADVRALVEHCNMEKPVIVAHSLGGHIASWYCAVYQNEVSKLALLDGMGPPHIDKKLQPDELRELLKEGIETVSDLGSEARQLENVAEALARLTGNNPQLRPALAKIIIENGVQPHPQGGVQWRWDPALRMLWHTFSHQESEVMWSCIECPVLMVTGQYGLTYWANMRKDLTGRQEFYESVLEHRQKLFKDARHVVIQGAGHMLHYDQPELLAATLREFLES